jgi:hypothetical protein
VISAVTAYALHGFFAGWSPIFAIPRGLAFEDPLVLPGFAILGILAGVLGAFLPMLFYRVRDFFRWLPGPPHLKPALGGVLAGLLGMQGRVEPFPTLWPRSNFVRAGEWGKSRGDDLIDSGLASNERLAPLLHLFSEFEQRQPDPGRSGEVYLPTTIRSRREAPGLDRLSTSVSAPGLGNSASGPPIEPGEMPPRLPRAPHLRLFDFSLL